MKRTSIVYLCLILTNFIFAQNPVWVAYNTINSGLPDNIINCITSDSFGNKWIGTDGGGLARFDGTTWTVYNSANSGLPENCITAVACETSGAIWIGTFCKGLVKFDGQTWTIFSTSNSQLINDDIQCISLDISNHLWVGTINGLQKFDGVQWTTFTTSNSTLPSDWINSINVDKNGSLWVSTGSVGVDKFDGTNWLSYGYITQLHDCLTIAFDSSGAKWVGSWGEGIDWFNEQTTQHQTYNTVNSSLPSNLVTGIVIDANQVKWISTYAGLARFDGTYWHVYNYENSGLPDNALRCLFLDSLGNIWLGTTFGGLVVYNQDGVTVGLSEKTISSDNIKVFSSTANEIITFELNKSEENFVPDHLMIVNLRGESLLTQDLPYETSRFSVHLSSFKQGMYIYVLSSKKSIQKKGKFVVR